MTQFTEMECGKCGIEFSVPTHFYDDKRANGNRFYCPNGHPRVFRESDADKYRRQRDRLQQRLAEAKENTAIAERATAAQKGIVTKMKKRASAGVCPCCNRTFQNLGRHMKSKHPGFGEEKAA